MGIPQISPKTVPWKGHTALNGNVIFRGGGGCFVF